MKKRVICSVLVAVMLLSMSALPISAGTTDFNDVFGHWAQADIMTLVDKGIISGYPDGTFQPDKSVTRAEFIKILAAALQLPQAAPAGVSPFSDVAMTDWFFEPVMEGVQNNLIGGFPDGTFLPNDPITREQVAKILVRAKGIDETSTVLMSQSQEIISKIPDWSQVSEWAQLFVINAIAADLMKGDPSGNFRPLASLTRAETAVIGVRMMVATPTPTPTAPPVTGGAFIFGRGADCVKLDPADVTDGESARGTVQIYDTLVQFKGETTIVEPALATSWEVSTDNLTWTFHLRQGVKFHDGADFNADAVLFNFERWWDESNAYHVGTFEYFSSMFNGFKGTEGCTFTKMEKVSDSAVRFTLAQPYAPLLSTLAMFCFAIASPTAIKAQGPENYGTSTQYPGVGTGAFKVVEWTKDDKLVLDRNPDYWGYKANVDQVILRVIPDNAARYLALKAGEIQGMEGANPEDAKAAAADPTLQVLLRPPMNVGTVLFKVDAPPFDNVNVRKALAMAINKQPIVDAFYGATGLVANQFLPPSLWGYNKELKDYAYDPVAAKQMLADAGYTDANPLTIDFWYMPNPRPYFPDPKAIAEAIAADLSKIGVVVNLKTEDWSTYLDDRKNGKFGLWMLGWTGDNGDPDNFLFFHYGVPRAGEGNYNNPALIKILLDAQKEVDQAKRDLLYQQAAVLIHDDCPRIFIGHNQVPLLFSTKVSGYVPNPTGTEFFNTVSIAP
ncbi:MAG: ABC transporter substrate-binding protein [Coprothermobacterota bacterium]|nr:ABC transporter substrate-binding protein [Coprothermobacterota bacterium]